MPLTQSKTYYTDNDASWSNTTTSTLMMASQVLAVQQALCGTILNTNAPSSAYWTVDYSCDGTTAGTAGDAVNRWTDATKVIRSSGAVAHSWTVLKHATLGYWLLIDYTGSADYNWKLYISKSAFTGGTTTAAPTSTVSALCETITLWDASDVTAAAGKLSKTVDAAGRFVLLWGKTGAAKAKASMGLVALSGGYVSDTMQDVLFCDVGTTTNPPLHVSQNNWRGSTRSMISRNYNNTVTVACSPLALCPSNASSADFLGSTMNGVDQQDGRYIDYPVRVGIVQSAATYGDKGLLLDWSWAPYNSSSSTLTQNQMALNSGNAPIHVLVGSSWVPWNSQPTW
jgi:hypothetical protein